LIYPRGDLTLTPGPRHQGGGGWFGLGPTGVLGCELRRSLPEGCQPATAMLLDAFLGKLGPQPPARGGWEG